MKRHFLLFAATLCAAGLFAQSSSSGDAAPAANPLVRRSSLLSRRSSAAAASPALAPAAGDSVETEMQTNGVPRLNFQQAPAELVLDEYAKQIKKTVLPAPDLPKPAITLKSQEDLLLSKEEYLEAIEVALSMNGIVLEPYGEKFIKALPRKTVRQHGIAVINDGTLKALPEKTRVVSQLIQFKYITAADAQKALEGFKDPSGLFQVFERNNSILVTDIQENINRMLELVKLLDVESPVMEDVFVRQIKNALAADVKKALETIVTESQKEAKPDSVGTKQSGSPGFARSSAAPAGPRLLNLNNRPGVQPQPSAAPAPNETLIAAVSDADRGMIRGKVLIVDDERSNKLIIITMKSNMDFFDKVIKELDVETTPEVEVKVVRLKYADAEEVASMMNDLIGNSSSSSQNRNAPQNTPRNNGSGNANLTRNTTQPSAPASRAGANSSATFSNANASRLGELNKDNVKILADKRINAVVVMARKSDMKAVNDVIEEMDVKLSQVLIETVIIQVELGDDLQTGVDWVQRGKVRKWEQRQATDQYGRPLYRMMTDDEGAQTTVFPSYKQGTETIQNDPIYEWVRTTVRDGLVNRGSSGLGGGGGLSTAVLQTMENIGTNVVADYLFNGASPIAGGINYLLKSDKLNIAAVIQATKDDSRTKVLASPILMTVDNKEATIEATDMIYLFSGYQYSGSSMYGSQVRNYEKRDIGLTVKVTPRINPNGTVVLTVEQTFETQGADQAVPNEAGGTDKYATVTTRKITSDVSVENRQTIVMGGLTKKMKVDSESGIPILKDIPIIGKWLFGSVTHKEARSELLVFMTPYVLDDARVAQAEAMRRKRALSDPRPWEDNGWSASPLADPVSKKEQLRRFQDEWSRYDEERRSKLAIEKAKMDRAKKLKDMTESERKYWIDLHKKELDKEAREEFEKKMAEQQDLKEFVEAIKKEDLEQAEAEMSKAKTVEKNVADELAEESGKAGEAE